MAWGPNGRDILWPQLALTGTRWPSYVQMAWSPKQQRYVLPSWILLVLMAQSPKAFFCHHCVHCSDRHELWPPGIMAETCSLAPTGSHWHYTTFLRSKWHRAANNRDMFSYKLIPQNFYEVQMTPSPKWQRERVPNIHRTPTFPKSPVIKNKK